MRKPVIYRAMLMEQHAFLAINLREVKNKSGSPVTNIYDPPPCRISDYLGCCKSLSLSCFLVDYSQLCEGTTCKQIVLRHASSLKTFLPYVTCLTLSHTSYFKSRVDTNSHVFSELCVATSNGSFRPDCIT